jgi:hypothetical protein
MKTFSEIQRDFFRKNVQVKNTDSESTLFRKYLALKSILVKQEKLETLEKIFLKYLIRLNSGTPNSKYISGLLVQLLTILHLKISRSLDENWRELYLSI